MRSKHLLTVLFALTCGHANGQAFVNGSLEGGAVPCSNIINSQFPTFLANAGYAFGTTDYATYKGRFYFYDASCSEGSAQKGSNFLGLAANDAGLVDAMALTLTAPLQANKTYTLTFYTKKAKTIPSIPLQIGYTTDSLAFGTFQDIVQAPTDQTWKLNTVHIRPTVATKFITVRTLKSNTGTFSYSYTLVDNFSIAVGTAVEPGGKAFSIAPHPNPFTTSLSLSLASGIALPCQLTLSDMTGRVVHEQSASVTDLQIPRGNISAGMYLLTIRDAAGGIAYSRVVAD